MASGLRFRLTSPHFRNAVVELNQIRYFLALARTLNFTRAAQHCNVTQPALTKAIQKLEHELGGDLILRERHLSQLTDLGKLVLPMLERAFAASQSALTSADGFQTKRIAPLKVALGCCVSPALIETPFSKIGRFVPGLQIELIEAKPRELPDLLLGGHVGAAFAGDEVGELPPRIDHLTLFRERVMALVSANSRFNESSELTAKDLSEVNWLECTGCDAAEYCLRRVFQSANDPKVTHRACTLMQLQHMVSAGFGVMLWPEHAPHIPTVIPKPIAGAVTRDVRLLVVAGRRVPPRRWRR